MISGAPRHRREDRILFACVRQGFEPRHRRVVEELARQGAVDWERLAATAESHGVLPIAGANLLRCDRAALCLPAAAAERLEVAAFENALLKEQDAARLAAALARLREAGLEAMLLKGAALDLLVYDEPWVVSSHDADLLLRPLPGFVPGERERELRGSLYRAGIESDLLEHHDVNMNGALPIPFAEIWRDARPIELRGQPAWVMGPEDLLISLCINSCRKRFLRLKGLFDIAETLRRTPALDWERLAGKARRYRCERIVFTALLVTAETVGCDLPEGALAGLGVGAVRAALLRRLAAWTLRATPLAGEKEGSVPLLLSYASYRWTQAWRSLRIAVAHPAGIHHPDPPPPPPSILITP